MPASSSPMAATRGRMTFTSRSCFVPKTLERALSMIMKGGLRALRAENREFSRRGKRENFLEGKRGRGLRAAGGGQLRRRDLHHSEEKSEIHGGPTAPQKALST